MAKDKTSGGLNENSTPLLQGLRELEEQAHRSADQWLGVVLEHTSDGISITCYNLETGKRQLILCNDRYVAMSGRTRQELMTTETLNDFVVVHRFHPKQPAWERPEAPQMPLSGLASWKRPDGRENYFEWVAAPVKVGQVVYHVGVDHDVTDLMQARGELRQNEATLQALLDVSPERCILTDLDGVVLAANKAAAGSFGMEIQELIGRNALEIVAPEVGAPRRQVWEQVIRTGKPTVFEDQRNGRHLKAQLHPVFDDRGQVCQIAVFSEDITDHKQAEQALLESEQNERRRRQLLTALHGLTNELSKAASLDELCRKAVELGRSRLGFERLGLWFASGHEGWLQGSYGTDEQGHLRDERHCKAFLKPDLAITEVVREKKRLVVKDISPLFDGHSHVVGHGVQAVAAVWDGEEIIGCLCTDHLLSDRPFNDGDGELLELYASALGHLYSRKAAEEALRQSEARYRAIIEDQTEMLGRFKADGTVTFVNKAYCDYFSKTAAEFINKTFFPTTYADDLVRLKAHLASITPQHPVDTIEHRVYVKGQIRWHQWTNRALFDADGNLTEFQSVGRDITDRKLAEQALGQLHGQLLTAREGERRRLAQDLHDSLGQRMIAMDYALRSAAGDNPVLSAALAPICRTCNELVQEIRHLCHGLYPPTLESLGLAASLRQIASECKDASDVRIEVDSSLEHTRFSGEVEIALFRICQEAVGNALRHGRAKQIILNLQKDDGGLTLRIEDNGTGFDSAQERQGMGLATMKERARAVGGVVEIASQRGRTVVTVRVPLDPNAPKEVLD